ncbi:MAG: aspartate kinase [Chitinophagaceae bacterium]
MQVFKFGGASVSSVEKIQQVGRILQAHQHQQLVVIISAMGKTTNALEKVADAFFEQRTTDALQLFDQIKKQHLTTAKYLLVTGFNACAAQLADFFTEAEWLLHDKPVRSYDYYYDQIVCIGELLSTCIVSYYLNEIGLHAIWQDVRDVLHTDDNFRDAGIDWSYSTAKIQSLAQHLPQGSICVTQGFIGATDENESTTLGREGSDYTAAIFANILSAESVTIWKDVEGVMSADPKQFANATYLPELSFEEVIEMAYYGAQVIHPKTIKPLQNKGIPLQVKCFNDMLLPGTTISSKRIKQLPPIVIIKAQQVLLQLNTLDYSFVGEQPMMALYAAFEQLKIKPNLIQTGAIGIQLCIDDKPEKIEALAANLAHIFDIQVSKGLQLFTVRHYNADSMAQLTAGKKIILEQKTSITYQSLVL